MYVRTCWYVQATASGTDATTMSAQGDGHDTRVVIRQSVAAVPVRQGWQTGLFDREDDGCDACTYSYVKLT